MTCHSTLDITMATYQILYWHDIPAQVRAKGEGRERVSAPLPQRFQEAIDNAAMAAGVVGSDEYTAAFRWSEPQEREGSADEVAASVAAELDAQFADIDWRATVEKIKPG
jgi:hypothetical protein